MAALTSTAVSLASPETDLIGSLVAAAVGGDTAEIRDRAFFVLSNGDASPHTATLATPGTVSGLAVADATLVVAAGDVGVIPLTNVFRGSTGRASITYDAVTSVTVGVFYLEV